MLNWSGLTRFGRTRSASSSARRQLGVRGERLAAARLKRAGYVIERRNVRFPVGELDLVARDGGTLCFIEVRSVSSDAWGGALASITDEKRRRVIRAAEWYLRQRAEMPAEVRFDVVAVQWGGGGRATVEVVKDAFTAG